MRTQMRGWITLNHIFLILYVDSGFMTIFTAGVYILQNTMVLGEKSKKKARRKFINLRKRN